MTKQSHVQAGLPFEDDGYTQSRETLRALMLSRPKKYRFVRPSKPDVSDLDLSQPLLCDMVHGMEMDWSMLLRQEDTAKKPLALIPGIFKDLPDYGTNTEFDLLDIEGIAKIAAHMLYSDLSTLIGGRGGENTKKEIIDWLFADTLVFAGGEEAVIPMQRFPFTAQFCCLVEEIDHDWLCYVINKGIDLARARQALKALNLSKSEEITYDTSFRGQTGSQVLYN